jgi:hypothetical protein
MKIEKIINVKNTWVVLYLLMWVLTVKEIRYDLVDGRVDSDYGGYGDVSSGPVYSVLLYLVLAIVLLVADTFANRSFKRFIFMFLLCLLLSICLFFV